MPPKAKITAEMIIEAAFETVRESGAENLTARTIAARLGCSTQPVLYYFESVEEIKKTVYKKADAYHSDYIADIKRKCDDPLTGIGLMYIRFAIEERNLFRFLFQSDEFAGKGIAELVDMPELTPILEMFGQFTGTDMQQTKQIFLMVFIMVHGYASLFANNMMEYDEEAISENMRKAMIGALYAVKSDEQ